MKRPASSTVRHGLGWGAALRGALLGLTFSGLVLSGSGCATNRETQRPVVAPAPVVAEPPTIPGVFESKRFGLRVHLAASDGWKIDDRTDRWLTFKQPSEPSTLLIRMWTSDNRRNRDKCETEARSFRTLPSREGLDLLEARRLDFPKEFDTSMDVLTQTLPDGRRIGLVLAFGGSVRRCFALVYVTEVGPDGASNGPSPGGPSLAEEKLALRLASFVSKTVETLEHRPDWVVQTEAADLRLKD